MGSQEAGLCARSAGESGRGAGCTTAPALDAPMRLVTPGTPGGGQGFSAHGGAGDSAMTDGKLQGEGNYDAAREYDE